jgi:hypothetical protein
MLNRFIASVLEMRVFDGFCWYLSMLIIRFVWVIGIAAATGQMLRAATTTSAPTTGPLSQPELFGPMLACTAITAIAAVWLLLLRR